ncbi:MAG: penicillin-binding protein 1A [Elainella sp. Prado103]|jgi:penicillin-binding protein 1A|nr:penicillin-binding protein 1A [Elainella sp. Prado103]
MSKPNRNSATHMVAPSDSPPTLPKADPSVSSPPVPHPANPLTSSWLSVWQRWLKERHQLPNQPHSPGTDRPLYQHWWAWGLVGLGLGIGGASLAGLNTIEAIRRDLPNTSDVLTYVRTGSLTIKSADDTVLQQIGSVTREKVALQDMPTRLSEAFIASEDQDFYQHGGIDYDAILRASLRNLLARDVLEGGSTITQQLARIVFLDQERSIGRKLREALLAQKMEQELNKQQILERYLNLVYLGSGAYGVADAAWIYFSKTVDQLTLGEMAMIAGMAPAPSDYSPLINPDLARRRRDIVLERMADVGFITASEMAAAKAQPIAVKPGAQKYVKSEAPYFTAYVQQQLPGLVSKEELELGGLTVETTLNLEWQKLAQETVNYAIRNYGPGEGFEQAALVALDPRNGEIRALVGGDDFGKSQFNRATQAQRQPGSTFKAFVYAAAIAAGFSPYDGYIDGKYVVDGYEPQNYGKNYRGSVSMKDALTGSINIVAVKVLVEVGFDPVIDLAKNMGVKSDLLGAYSLALGSSEVNLLELTNAYGTFANEGNAVDAHGITRVYNRFGKLIYEAKYSPSRAIDADSASIMTWMLEGVVANGTGRNAYLPDRPVAGKTGTSEKRRDLWFVGYIPQLVTGVWLGNDDSSPTYGQSSTAALTWYDFMIEATEDLEVEEFPDLPDIDSHKGSIKAEPIKPGRVFASNNPYPSGRSDSESEEGESWSDRESGSSWSDSGGSGSDYSSDSYSGGSSSESYSDYSGESYSEPAPAEPAAPPPAEPAPAEAALEPAPPAEPVAPVVAEPAPPVAEPAPISAPPPIAPVAEPAPPPLPEPSANP